MRENIWKRGQTNTNKKNREVNKAIQDIKARRTETILTITTDNVDTRILRSNVGKER